MDNSPRLPILSAIGAIIAGLVTMVLWWGRDADQNWVPGLDGALQYVYALNELEIALTALAVTLAIFAVIGLISYVVEGRELRPGRILPRLSGQLTIAISILALALIVDVIVLAVALVQEWSTAWLCTLAGIGSILIAFLLVLYKEAFVGEEARFDDRKDGIPW
jgi:uncharacterized membrane protein